MEKVAPKFPFSDCGFMGKGYDCKNIFTRVLTSEGICYSFNVMDRSEIFRKQVFHYKDFHQVGRNSSAFDGESGYNGDIGPDIYPQRTLIGGMNHGLFFWLNQMSSNSDEFCGNIGEIVDGYRLFLHHPAEILTGRKQFYHFANGKMSIASITPELIRTSDKVKNYNVEKRKCYLKGERQLKYYKIYTQNNCDLECLTNVTLRTCGCVNLFMPRMNGSECICPITEFDSRICIHETEGKMGEFATEFITKFHNLPGETPKEKQASFFALILEFRPILLENSNELDSIATNLIANNYLEMIFRVDFLVYFRRLQELYEEFRNGDEIVLRRLSREKWFFKEAFQNLKTEQFVNEVMPSMSYVAKMKILKRVSFDEQQNDEVFDALHERYGLHLATRFFLKCSIGKIKHLLQKYRFELNLGQLKILFDRDPDLIVLCFEERAKHGQHFPFTVDYYSDSFLYYNDNINSLFAHIAQKNPEIFVNLINKYKFEIRLGHRVTKTFLNTQKHHVLADFDFYFKILNTNSLVRKLGPELKQFFFKPNPKEREYYWKSLLWHYPTKKLFEVFESAYNQTHNRKFGEDIDIINEQVLTFVKPNELREKLAKAKFEKCEKERYYKYYNPKEALQIFLDKLDQMNSKQRTRYVEIVVNNSGMREDTEVLLEISKLVAGRFKNDSHKIHEYFIQALTYSCGGSILDKINDENWKLIMDVFTILQTKNIKVHNEYIIISKYIKFLMKNKKSINETLSNYPDWLSNSLQYGSNDLDLDITKAILEQIIEIHRAKSDTTPDIDFKLLRSCVVYNRKRPKDSIDIGKLPRFAETIKHGIDTYEAGYVSRNDIYDPIKYIVLQQEQNDQFKEILKTYFDNFGHIGEIEICYWFLLNKPKIFADHFEQFLEHCIYVRKTDRKSFWQLIKKFSNLGLDRRTVEFCKKKLNEENFKQKRFFVRILSIMAQRDSHLEFVKSFLLPSDSTEDQIKEFYSNRCLLIRYLHHINAPAAAMELTLQFCNIISLRSALPSLHSSFYRLPENQTKKFMDQMSNYKMFSSKKQMVILGCAIYDSNTVYDILKDAQLVSLLRTFRYFVKSPSEQLWNLIEKKLWDIGAQSTEIFDKLLYVPMSYELRIKCIELIFKILSKDQSDNLIKFLIKNSNNENIIKSLQMKTLNEVIKTDVLNKEESQNWIANLFIHSTDNAKFNFMSRVLSELKDNFKANKRDSYKLNKLISNVHSTYMNLNRNDKELVNNFSSLFQKIFSLVEAFEESCMIEFMKLKDENVEEVAKYLIKINNELIDKYGKRITISFAQIINNHLVPHLFKTDQQKFELCLRLLEFKQSPDDCILIIKLLPNNEPKNPDMFALYSNIINSLKMVENNTVQVYLNVYFKIPQTPEVYEHESRYEIDSDDD